MFGFVNKILKSPVSVTKLKGDGPGSGNGVVTVLLSHGEVLEFPCRMKCSGLLAAYPGHTVCHATALVLHQQVKMLSNDAYLEEGEIYFLLAKPEAGPKSVKKASKGKLETSSLLTEERSSRAGQQSQGSSSVKFVISKQYLAKILEEGSRRGARLTRSETNPQAKALQPLAVRRLQPSNTWSGPLESIAEVAS